MSNEKQTPKKTISDFTDEIKAKIPEYKSRAVDRLYAGYEYDEWKLKDTVDYIDYIHNLGEIKNKTVVIVANDLLEYRKYYNLLFSEDKISDKYVELIESEFDKINAGQMTSMDTKFYDLAKIDIGLKKNNKILLAPCNYHFLFIASEYTRVHLMWYKFIKDEFKLPFTKEKELDWLYDNINKANIAKCFFCEKVTLVLRMPRKIVRNETNISNLDGPAIEYPNMKLYYINGVNVSEKMFERLSTKKYTFSEWSKEQNEEIKAAALFFMEEKFGGEYSYRFLSKHLTEVDTYVDKKDPKYLVNTKGMNVGTYTLFKGNINNIDIAYVRCHCPSTDRMFFLGVDPENNNAKDAIASLCMVPRKLKDKIESISRQGEIFSINFDKKGTEMLAKKVLTQEDYADTVSVSGDEYFSKMKFEY